MPLAFKTPDDFGASIEIAAVGQAGPNGSSPVPLDRAAQRMPELQNPDGTPLEGAALKAAATAWAEEHDLEVANVTIVEAPLDVAHPTGIDEASPLEPTRGEQHTTDSADQSESDGEAKSTTKEKSA